MVGTQVRKGRKMRLDVEVAVSDVGYPSIRAAVHLKPGHRVEVDTIFLEALEDKPEGLHTRHPPRGVEAGVPVE